jgi:hypothetical protein
MKKSSILLAAILAIVTTEAWASKSRAPIGPGTPQHTAGRIQALTRNFETIRAMVLPTQSLREAFKNFSLLHSKVVGQGEIQQACHRFTQDLDLTKSHDCLIAVTAAEQAFNPLRAYLLDREGYLRRNPEKSGPIAIPGGGRKTKTPESTVQETLGPGVTAPKPGPGFTAPKPGPGFTAPKPGAGFTAPKPDFKGPETPGPSTTAPKPPVKNSLLGKKTGANSNN